MITPIGLITRKNMMPRNHRAHDLVQHQSEAGPEPVERRECAWNHQRHHYEGHSDNNRPYARRSLGKPGHDPDDREDGSEDQAQRPVDDPLISSWRSYDS